MTKARRIRKELRELRAECIDGVDDPILRRLAYEMECAVRYATEDVRGWPSLSALAVGGAVILRNELEARRRRGT